MIQPVGAMIQPVSPTQGLSSLNSILGIRQAQQNLQTGAIAQQTALAQQQQQQQTTQQRQAAANFFQNYDVASHIGPDGTLDLDQALTNPALKATGDAYPAIAKSIIDMKNAQLDAKSKLASLDSGVRQNFYQNVGGLSNDPDVKAGNQQGVGKVLDAIDRFGKSGGPDAARVADTYRPLVQNIAQAGQSGKLPEVLSNWQLQALDAGKQREQTYGTPTTINTGAAITGAVQAPPSAGGGLSPAGPSIATQTPPANMYGPGGSILHVPGGGAGLPSTAGGGGAAPASAPTGKLIALPRPGLNAPKADQDAYNAQIAAATQEVTGARNAANDPMNGVQSTRFRNQQILDLIPHADTGPGLRVLNTIASRLPGSSGDAYQDLEHYTAQNSAALAQKMGVPHTNLGAETAGAAAGNVERNPGALAEITKTNDALNTAFDLYNRGLQRVTNNGGDMTKVNAYKQAFGNSLDVNAVRYADAYRRGDKAEIADLTKKLGPKGIAAAQQNLKVLKSLAGTGDLP